MRYWTEEDEGYIYYVESVMNVVNDALSKKLSKLYGKEKAIQLIDNLIDGDEDLAALLKITEEEIASLKFDWEKFESLHKEFTNPLVYFV